MKEIEVYGNNKYLIDREGVVYRRYNGIIIEMKQRYNEKGYKIIGLSYRGKQKHFKVHRLVGYAFIPNPLNKPQINHKNGIKDDNRVSNLEWVSNKENNEHAIDNGLINRLKGSEHPRSKLKEEDVIDIRKRVLKGETYRSIYEDYKIIGWWTFRDICRGESWKHIKV